MAGKLITFEGIEGSGKTTQIHLLSGHLRNRKVDHLVTREPGGTGLGNEVRKILLDPEEMGIDPLTELFLYLAVRAQHFRELLGPALAEGRVVLCDRFSDATIAYQGYGRGISLSRIQDLHRATGLDRKPDLTLLLDLEVKPALQRTRKRVLEGVGQSRYDREEESFHGKVREGYRRIAEQEADRVRLVDGSGSIQEVQKAIIDIVNEFLGLEGSGGV